MRLYRLSSRKHVGDLSGEGARLFGGRWNRAGVPALYASSHLSLSVCEIIVHADYDHPPVDMAYVELEVPDDLISGILKDADPFGSTEKLGSEALLSGGALGYFVPSVIVPIEYNVILNPLHPDAVESIRVIGIRDFEFDPRFRKDEKFHRAEKDR